MYVDPNYPSKKALRTALKSGEIITVFSPGPFPCPTEGTVTIEGPHFPKPHSWYAQVKVELGYVVKVIS